MALPVLVPASRRPIPVTINSRDIELDKDLERVVILNLRGSLGRFSHQVRNASVWIEDTNGPREGSGIRCRIDLVLKRGGRFSVSAEAANEYVAVDRATNRAWAILDRRFKKRRDVRRRARTPRN